MDRILEMAPLKFPDYSVVSDAALFAIGNGTIGPIACDEVGNIYFYHLASHQALKLDLAADECNKVYNTQTSLRSYRGMFNYAGDKIIFGYNIIYIVPVDSKRAKGWSGPGGDICATNNANIIWAE